MLTSRVRFRLITVAGVALAMGAISALSMGGIDILVDALVPPHTYLDVALGGILVGGLLAAYELLLVDGPWGRPIRRAPAWGALALNLVVYAVVIGGVYAAYKFGVHGDDPPGFYMGVRLDIDPHVAATLDLLGALATFLLLFFVVLLRRVVGGKALAYLVLGRYRRHQAEDRIFLFLDMVGSTRMAEELGDLRASELIARVFFDIDEPVLHHGGHTHRYVGDAVMVTWTMERGLAGGACLRCALDVQDMMAARAEAYRAEFGWAPQFRAGLHGGRVIAGECGDSRRQIAYFGDTVNTAARIEAACRMLDRPVLASAALVDRLAPRPPAPSWDGRWDGIAFEDMGRHVLRGKAEPIGLYAVRRV